MAAKRKNLDLDMLQRDIQTARERYEAVQNRGIERLAQRILRKVADGRIHSRGGHMFSVRLFTPGQFASPYYRDAKVYRLKEILEARGLKLHEWETILPWVSEFVLYMKD